MRSTCKNVSLVENEYRGAHADLMWKKQQLGSFLSTIYAPGDLLNYVDSVLKDRTLSLRYLRTFGDTYRAYLMDCINHFGTLKDIHTLIIIPDNNKREYQQISMKSLPRRNADPHTFKWFTNVVNHQLDFDRSVAQMTFGHGYSSFDDYVKSIEGYDYLSLLANRGILLHTFYFLPEMTFIECTQFLKRLIRALLKKENAPKYRLNIMSDFDQINIVYEFKEKVNLIHINEMKNLGDLGAREMVYGLKAVSGFTPSPPRTYTSSLHPQLQYSQSWNR